MYKVLGLSGFFLSQSAWATVDPKCADLELPEDYNEQSQADFLQNYSALATTLSPVHAPIPHEPGHGAIGLDLAGYPPLGCKRRLVLNYTKTEDTNKTPVIPRPRVTYSFPKVGPFVPYAGVAYIPPVTMFGTRNVILSGEMGVGAELGEHFQVGGRFHATSQKTIGEIAAPFVEGDPPVDDLFIGSTFGLDAMFGYKSENITPYAAIGFTDVSTFFYIGDDNVVANNLHPYLGMNFSAGVDMLIKERFRFGAEFYGAPGGHSLPDKSAETVTPGSRYGHLYTGRFRFAVEL